jgi:hypothetical protein
MDLKRPGTRAQAFLSCGLLRAPVSRLMPHTFWFGSVENTLQARRKQIPALKARNSKARGETPGLDGCGTSPARAAQLLCRPCRARPTFCPRAQGSRARCRVLFHPQLCCAAPPALGCAFCCSAHRITPEAKSMRHSASRRPSQSITVWLLKSKKVLHHQCWLSFSPRMPLLAAFGRRDGGDPSKL